MAVHPRLKTTKKGLRPFAQDEIAPALHEPAQRIKGWVESLNDSQPLNKRDVYLIARVKLAAERLIAPTQAEKDRILIELNRLEDEGYLLNFDKNDIWGANAVAILIRKEGRLAEFIRQAGERLKNAK